MNCIDKGLEHNPHWEDGICIRCGVDCHFDPVVFTGSAHGCHYQIRDTGMGQPMRYEVVNPETRESAVGYVSSYGDAFKAIDRFARIQ